MIELENLRQIDRIKTLNSAINYSEFKGQMTNTLMSKIEFRGSKNRLCDQRDRDRGNRPN